MAVQPVSDGQRFCHSHAPTWLRLQVASGLQVARPPFPIIDPLGLSVKPQSANRPTAAIGAGFSGRSNVGTGYPSASMKQTAVLS